MLIAKEGALKAFYYLMAIDGIVASEKDCFHEIGVELFGDVFHDMEESVIAECESSIQGTDAEERYDIIQENLDEALGCLTDNLDEGIASRHLLWNMLSLSYSDSEYSKEENRLISHVARVLQIDKSVFAEMKLLISVISSVNKEKTILEESLRPYAEIKPLIDEMQRRQGTILGEVRALIEDEIVSIPVKMEKKKDNVLLETSKKITSSVVAESKKISDNMSPATSAIKEKGAVLSDRANKGAEALKTGAGRLFSKVKESAKKKK